MVYVEQSKGTVILATRREEAWVTVVCWENSSVQAVKLTGILALLFVRRIIFVTDLMVLKIGQVFRQVEVKTCGTQIACHPGLLVIMTTERREGG